MARWILTISTAACLVGLYSAYAIIVRPVVDVSQVRVQPRPPVQLTKGERPAENVRLAEENLPDQPWAQQARVQLRTRDCVIYANDWQPEGEKALIRCRPFAMIWTRVGRDGGDEAITVTSESAQLQFASRFENTNPNPGRVVGAALLGEVRITGPDGLVVAGRDFIFSEDALKIWSDNPIQFAFGPHRGKAKGLDIELIPSTLPPGRDRPAVQGIRNVRLQRNVEMDLVLGERKRPTPVKITSASSFNFQVEQHVATFETLVRAARETGPKEFDWLECHRLTLFFVSKDGETESRPAVDEEFQTIDLDLEFHRLQAIEGDRQKVVLGSQGNHLHGELSELHYDAKERQVVASGRGQPVKIVQQNSQIVAPEFTLWLDEAGRIATAVCRGAGWLETRNPVTGEIEFAADWQKQLRKVPDPESNLDIIELEQQATFRQPGRQTALGAERIRVWTTPLQASSDSEVSAASAQPQRMVAEREVALVSPQLQAECQHLDVLFDPSPPKEALAIERVSANSRLRPPHPLGEGWGEGVREVEPLSIGEGISQRRSPNGRRSRTELQPAIRQVSVTDTTVESTEATETLPAVDEPLHLVADQIRVRMFQTDRRQPELAEVWTDGNVTVTQSSSHRGVPLSLTGERMHLENAGENRQIMHLYGRPAHIRNGDMHLQGGQIHLKRQENFAWVDGEGLLQFPVKHSLAGEPLEQPQMLDVTWKDGMTFDGRSAGFDRDVQVVLGDSRVLCQQMQVQLNRRLSFTESNQDTSGVEIERIDCGDGVEFDSSEYEQGVLTEVRRARVWEFSLDQATGETTAQGPGWLAAWRRGKGKGAALSLTQQVQANQPLRTEQSEWEYTRIDFAGRMEGNLHRRHTTFHDQVQVVYGPVDRPADVVNPNHPDKLARDAGWMKCDRLEVTQHTASDGGPAYVQLLGNGNTYLAGRNFDARADQISFDQSKGLYVLRSLGNGKANIWRQLQPGGDRTYAEAQRMEFIPSENRLKLDRATGGEGLNP